MTEPDTTNELDVRRVVEAETRKYRDFLLKFLEEDTDDFTGMHTTRGIPEDGFYSLDLERNLVKAILPLITKEKNKARLWGQMEALNSFYNQGEIGSDSYKLSVGQIAEQLNELDSIKNRIV